ncbi:sugar transferase [Pseudogracilibacillus sp. SE30717A]|uniref:sugar transferase n=1 Tax=Pseudogracilibacillus sp. SE30717A TaxID=3098293 RepID=UPI00300DD789
MQDKVKSYSLPKNEHKTIWKDQISYYLNVKRALEIFASLLLIIIFSPLFLLVSLAILITCGRPIFFRQERIGKDAQPFIIWKFRTMKENKMAQELNTSLWINGIADDFIFKSEPSSYVTTIGIWLRKFSIDEIPQLINVLKGDMSFVGPRPETLKIAKYYNEYQKRRLLVKPGITGYAQIKGRSHMTHGQKIEYDLYYVKNQSLSFDLIILFLTIIKVIKTEGAI